MGHLVSWFQELISLEDLMTHWCFDVINYIMLIASGRLINGNLKQFLYCQTGSVVPNKVSHIRSRHKIIISILFFSIFCFLCYLLFCSRRLSIPFCLSFCLFYFLTALSLGSHKMTYIYITKVKVMPLHCQCWQDHYTIAPDWCSVDEMDANK